MAQRVHIELVDDLNGEIAQETVRFGLDGVEYELDLTTENAATFRSAVSEYADKGRKVTGGRPGRRSQRGNLPGNSRREEVQRIRQWAEENGHNPSSRGRVSQSIVDAYNAATK
ncbi:Lsr2 family protein [Arthrobacter sp. Soc17.1.1.1]|uniref:histone-like nucleoid-structuring protein Lsr2 n=1 Tax=Arthrobacter sp. Soc17.1.1.1 TaxID=3121277 RepID=UPI002FE4A030